MEFLRFTLVSDGSSDRCLMPILEWLLREVGRVKSVAARWADFSYGATPRGLSERLDQALRLYPCDVLFVHRDAERQNPALRYEEVTEALAEVSGVSIPPAICVIPVRMQEAWLLFDESAIRNAAGNPNGRDELALPKLSAIESIPDPKAVLHGLLRQACGLSGRRLKNFAVAKAALLVTQYATDFSKLRALPAFDRLERDISTLRDGGWKGVPVAAK